MAKQILGIDIGYDTLKLALVQGKRVRKTAVAPMPKRLLREGRVASPEAMGELIRSTMKENGIRCSQAALAFSPEAVFVRNVTVPVMSAEQLSYNLPYEFRDYITDDLKNYVFDYAMLEVPTEQKAQKAANEPKKQDAAKKKKQNALEAFTEEQNADPTVSLPQESVVSTEEATMEMLAVSAPASLLDESRVLLRHAGLKLAKAAPVICSYIGLIQNMDDADRPETGEYCFLDLGYQAIRMYMFKGTRHEVTRALEFGLSRVVESIADAYNVDVHLAHTYLQTNYEDCQSQDVCMNVFNNIAVELIRVLNFYRFSNPDSNLSDVWLCGGGAGIEPLRQAIADGLENMKLHSTEELISDKKPIEQSYSMVQAIGIAQY